MILVFADEVLARLNGIERREGIPPEELVRQAVEVWTQLTASERQALGLAAMRMVMERSRT